MKYLNRLRKWIAPPAPMALGRSETNFLPSKLFDPFTNKYTWSDWREEVKRDYPVRFWLTSTLSMWFSVHMIRLLSNFKWWVIDLFRRPHMLDLKNEEYKGGYNDPCQAVLYANFNLLKIYVEKCQPYNLRDDSSEEEIDKEGLRPQQDHYDEAHKLYEYWTVTRQKMRDSSSLAFNSMHIAVTRKDEALYRRLKKDWLDAEISFDKVEDEALLRLIKIRRSLWT